MYRRPFSALTRLEPVPVESLKREYGEIPLALVLKEDAGERKAVFVDKPWDFVAENVKRGLLSSFQRVESEMVGNENEVKSALVARVGRIMFRGNPSSLECMRRSALTESSLRKLKRSFYTNVPPPYMESITNKIVQKVGLNFEQEKEMYYVKIEVNPVHHLVADVSCLGKSLDIRLALCTKRILIALTNEEIDGIKALISSAILDPDVKGGLRWPIGKDSSGDRFNFITSSGEVAREVTLKLHGIVSQLQEQACEDEPVFQMLRDNLKLIWDNFLCLVLLYDV